MSMFMVGGVPDEARLAFNSPFVSFRSRDDGDGEDGVYYENGWSGLYSVIALWDALGSDKGRELYRMLKEEVEVGSNTDEAGTYRLTPPQIERVLALIEGLEEALKPLMDDNWHVRPEHVERLRRRAPNIITRRSNADGNTLYSLDEKLGEALGVEWFLRHAAQFGREVRLG